MLNILYAMLYFYSFHDASIFLRAFPLQKQGILFIVTIIALKWKQSDLIKHFFLLKDIYFKKKVVFLQNNKKKRTTICTDLCKSI